MPAAFQGTVFRSAGDPIMDLKPPESVPEAQMKERLNLLEKLNQMDAAKNPGNSELAARISSYELAYRMQGCAPNAVEIENESEATKKLYGLDNPVVACASSSSIMADLACRTRTRGTRTGTSRKTTRRTRPKWISQCRGF